MRIVLTGSSGQLGAYLHRRLIAAGHDVLPRDALARWCDLTSFDSYGAKLDDDQPDAIIHAAALSKPVDAQRDPAAARLLNTSATQRLAEAAARRGVRLVYLSTDMVFDGERGMYLETDAPNPLSVYGRTKLDAEPHVLDAGGLVLRLSLLFGPSLIGRPTFFDQLVNALRRGEPVKLFHDEFRTPLSLFVAAECITRAAVSEVVGLFHLGGPQRMSRLEMGRRLAALLGVTQPNIQVVSRNDIASSEPRPRDTSLDSSRFHAWFADCPNPDFDEAAREMCHCS